MKGRLLVEAALEEVVSLVAAHLDVLQVRLFGGGGAGKGGGEGGGAGGMLQKEFLGGFGGWGGAGPTVETTCGRAACRAALEVAGLV